MIFYGSSLSANLEFENIVNIEVSISEKGLPVFEIYGLVAKSIDESKKRIINSFESIGVNFPLKNILVNLSPAEFPKDGTHYDLGIAAAILRYSSSLSYNSSEDIFLGELSFDGSVVELKNIVFLVLNAIKLGFKKIYVPSKNINQLEFIKDVQIFAVDNLRDLLNLDILPKLTGGQPAVNEFYPSNFNKILGNKKNKRALALAIAGKHHLLIKGFPGSGKSLLAKASQDLLPNLSLNQAYDVAKSFSYLGIERKITEFYRPPFRSPHSSSSYSAIFGSSARGIVPGEVNLANHGVLFLDEFPEFNRLVLEGLRSPLEDKKISISRANLKKTFDSDFLLLAAMNPCKCGYFNHPKIECKCSPFEIRRYQNRVSGPILDRIDINLNFDGKIEDLNNSAQNNYSYEEFKILKNRVEISRESLSSFLSNKSTLEAFNNSSINFIHSIMSEKSRFIIKSIQENYSVSNRKYFKVLRLSLTIAFFNNRESIHPEDVLEAVQLAEIK